jgi:hypothetical protein
LQDNGVSREVRREGIDEREREREREREGGERRDRVLHPMCPTNGRKKELVTYIVPVYSV